MFRENNLNCLLYSSFLRKEKMKSMETIETSNAIFDGVVSIFESHTNRLRKINITDSYK